MTTINQVAQQYSSLRLSSLACALEGLLVRAEENELSYLQFSESLVACEIKERNEKRIALNRRKAGFPLEKSLEEFNYRHQTTITKRQVNQLLDLSFIDNRSNLVFIGPPGVGKTHLATAIGLKVITSGYKVLFSTALALTESLEMARVERRAEKEDPRAV